MSARPCSSRRFKKTLVQRSGSHCRVLTDNRRDPLCRVCTGLVISLVAQDDFCHPLGQTSRQQFAHHEQKFRPWRYLEAAAHIVNVTDKIRHCLSTSSFHQIPPCTVVSTTQNGLSSTGHTICVPARQSSFTVHLRDHSRRSCYRGTFTLRTAAREVDRPSSPDTQTRYGPLAANT